MCAVFELNEVHLRPSLPAAFWRDLNVPDFAIWAGFAQCEKLAWWTQNGAVVVDVPATRFAERSKATGILRWDDVPPGKVIRGVIVQENGHALLKVVTRASTPEELAHFEHPRMPLLEPPLYSANPIEYPTSSPSSNRPLQQELF